MEDLEPVGINQKSYYGKAKTESYYRNSYESQEDIHVTDLYSYETLVARYYHKSNVFEFFEDAAYSPTTIKHVNSFIKKMNSKMWCRLSKRQIELFIFARFGKIADNHDMGRLTYSELLGFTCMLEFVDFWHEETK